MICSILPEVLNTEERSEKRYHSRFNFKGHQVTYFHTQIAVVDDHCPATAEND